MKKIEIGENEKLLIIAPHPDDECIGMGGLLSQYGSQCDVWVISDGAAGKSNEERRDIIAVRKEEFQHEMQFYHVNSYKMFDLPDGHLAEYEDYLCSSEIEKYNKIFIINGDDISVDHRAVYRMLMKAMDRSNKHNLLEVYQYEVTYPLKRVTHYFDISNYVEKKILGIKYHRSQLCIFDQIRPSIALNSYRAGFIDEKCEYAEAFWAVDVAKTKEQGSIVDIELQKTRYELYIEKLLCEVLLDKTLLNKFCENRDVYIYGYGHYGKKIEKLFYREKIEIKAIVDEYKSAISTVSEKGIKIINRASIINENELVIIAIQDLIVTEQIKRELENNNIKYITLEDFLLKIRRK